MRKALRHINTPNVLIISALALMMMTAAMPSVALKTDSILGRANTFTRVVAR